MRQYSDGTKAVSRTAGIQRSAWMRLFRKQWHWKSPGLLLTFPAALSKTQRKHAPLPVAYLTLLWRVLRQIGLCWRLPEVFPLMVTWKKQHLKNCPWLYETWRNLPNRFCRLTLKPGRLLIRSLPDSLPTYGDIETSYRSRQKGIPLNSFHLLRRYVTIELGV